MEDTPHSCKTKKKKVNLTENKEQQNWRTARVMTEADPHAFGATDSNETSSIRGGCVENIES
jgi:hypothetical protein